MLTDSDLQAIWLTAKLASIVTLILLVIGTPIAWQLSRTKAWWKSPVSAIVAMPLVLPPSVIGFYLLISMGPNGIIGQLTESLGWAACLSPSGGWSLPPPFIRCRS